MSSICDSDSGLCVGTWGQIEGRQLWKASYLLGKDQMKREAYFTAPRDTDTLILFAIADVLMGNPLDTSDWSPLEDDNRQQLHGERP